MKKFISVIAIMLMLALTACSNKETPPTTDNSSNTQSDSVTMLEEGVYLNVAALPSSLIPITAR